MSDKPRRDYFVKRETPPTAEEQAVLNAYQSASVDVATAVAGDAKGGEPNPLMPHAYVAPKAPVGCPISGGVSRPYASKATVRLFREIEWKLFTQSFTRLSRFRVRVAWRQAACALAAYLKFTWKLWTGDYVVQPHGNL